MSLSRAELEAMSEDELVETIVGLADKVADTQATVETLREDSQDTRRQLAQLRGDLADAHDRIDTLEAENERLRARLDGRSTHDKDGKVAAIVEAALNQANGDPAIKLDYSHIQAATGCSKRYAYDLMDRLPEEYDWFLTPQEMDQYGSIEIDNYDARRLGVDIEGVHSSGVPVNKFTTAGGSNGGAE